MVYCLGVWNCYGETNEEVWNKLDIWRSRLGKIEKAMDECHVNTYENELLVG